MTRDDLIELSDLNFAESLRELARRGGGTVQDEADILLFAGNHPLPVLVNGAMRTGSGPGPDEVLARARDFFAPRRRGFSVLIRAHLDSDLRAAAAGAGLVELGEMPAMILDHRLPDAAPPRGVEIRRVATDSDVAAYSQVMEAAYLSLGMPTGLTSSVLGKAAVLIAPHIVAFLVLMDGKPAAGAMTIVTHGVAGVYWVGTVPEARGRGLAELCTRAAGNAGFDLGARIASLQASPMGEPVYHRMGYFEVTRYPNLVHFEPPA